MIRDGKREGVARPDDVGPHGPVSERWLLLGERWDVTTILSKGGCICLMF